MGKASKNLFWIIVFLVPVTLMFLLIYAAPLVIAFISSFSAWDGFSTMKFIGISNYIALIKDPDFVQAMLNTLKWALAAALIHVPFGVLVALILSKKFRGWRFVRASFMLPNVISGAGMAILFLFVYKPDGGIINSVVRLFGDKKFDVNWLFDTRYAFFAVTNTWLWYAAVITLITMSELLSISPSVYEAARIDGANSWQMDIFISLPLLRRIIGTGMIIAITAVFKMFDVIFMTTNGGPGNATMNLAVMMVNTVVLRNQYGYANAIGIVLLLMGVVAMAISLRVFRMNAADDE